MHLDGPLVEQIVSGVLEQLRTQPPPTRADQSVRVPKPRKPQADTTPPQPASDVVTLTENVITAEVLERRLDGARRVLVGPRSILTPSAHEVLRRSRIEWSRGAAAVPDTATTSTGWTALVLAATPAVDTALDELLRSGEPRWRRELVGSVAEAVEKSVSAICRGESRGVAIFAEPADAIACRANRNRQVRAAAVRDAQHVRAVRQSMGANVIVIPSGGKGYFELRTMLRAFANAGPPQPPAEWMEG